MAASVRQTIYLRPDAIEMLVCEVAEGTVHRLWEPLAHKQRPPNGYAAKFSAPYCIAAGLVRGGVGLEAFTDDAVRDPLVRGLAAKVRYAVDPKNPYPANYTGHVRAVLRDGRAIEERQPHLRGGAREPLERGEIQEKFLRNARHGAWPEEKIAAALALAGTLFDGPAELSALRD